MGKIGSIWLFVVFFPYFIVFLGLKWLVRVKKCWVL